MAEGLVSRGAEDPGTHQDRSGGTCRQGGDGRGQQQGWGGDSGERVRASVGISEGMFSRGETGLITCGSWWSGGLGGSEG